MYRILTSFTHTLSTKHADNNSTEELPLWIVGRGGVPRTVPIDYSVQMMHKPEVDLVASYLRPDAIYLEWGSGGSTLNFASLVSDMFSIEHDCEWLRYVEDTMSSSNKSYHNVKTLCVAVEPGTKGWGTTSSFEHGNYDQFKPYVDAVDTLGIRKLDVVFIDGRARMACALKVLPYLKKDSVVFIHDFYTRIDIYKGVLKYYDEVARVLATTENRDPRMGPIEEPQGLVVLRRKSSIEDLDLPLTEDTIHKEYSSIDWRQGAPEPLTSMRAYFNYRFGYKAHLENWERPHNPENLLKLVKGDVLRIAFMYAILALLYRHRKHLLNRFFIKKRKADLSEDRPGRFVKVTVNRDVDNSAGTRSKGAGVERAFTAENISVVDTDAVARAAARRKFRIQRAASSPPR